MKVDKNTVAGVACAAVCALCVWGYAQMVRGAADKERSETLARYGGEQVEVCVASRDISAGETVDSSDVTMQLWLAGLLPDGAVTKASQVVGKQATSPILAGEVVSARRFASLASQFEVPAGLVAVSVSAKEVQAVGGVLAPGMMVDVYATGASATKAIAKNVLVLATSACGSDGSSSGAALSWVALAVDPASVSEMIAAEEKTQLYFALPGQSVGANGEAQHGK